ncbi:MAG: hypothetical protein KIS96_11420 [Bauldia sp.]|nr:hypothetical protein [Bauldia sp.]
MEIREHAKITDKHLRQAVHYTRWYCCTSGKCQTTLVMPPEFAVWRDGKPQRRIDHGPSAMDTPEAAVRRVLEETPPLTPSQRGDGDPAKLLHQLVMAVINAGQAHIFAGCPEVIAHYGGRFPDADEFAAAIGISRDQVPLPDGRVLSYAIAGPAVARRVDSHGQID